MDLDRYFFIKRLQTLAVFLGGCTIIKAVQNVAICIWMIGMSSWSQYYAIEILNRSVLTHENGTVFWKHWAALTNTFLSFFLKCVFQKGPKKKFMSDSWRVLKPQNGSSWKLREWVSVFFFGMVGDWGPLFWSILHNWGPYFGNTLWIGTSS